MSKIVPPEISPEKDSMREYRKEMMRTMAEVSFCPANVSTVKQEDLAFFMVSQLKSYNEKDN